MKCSAKKQEKNLKERRISDVLFPGRGGGQMRGRLGELPFCKCIVWNLAHCCSHIQLQKISWELILTTENKDTGLLSLVLLPPWCKWAQRKYRTAWHKLPNLQLNLQKSSVTEKESKPLLHEEKGGHSGGARVPHSGANTKPLCCTRSGAVLATSHRNYFVWGIKVEVINDTFFCLPYILFHICHHNPAFILTLRSSNSVFRC